MDIYVSKWTYALDSQLSAPTAVYKGSHSDGKSRVYVNYKDGTFISVLDATEISREWFVVLFQMEVNLFHKFASLKSNQIKWWPPHCHLWYHNCQMLKEIGDS